MELREKLKSLESNYTKELADVKEQLNFLMTWIHPLGSKENPAISCKGILKRDRYARSGKYYIKVNDTNFPGNMMQVYCIMRASYNCPAGITQVMKIDGRKNTFRYSSSFWSNKKMFNPENGKTGCDFTETKLATYWSTPFESICVRMRPHKSWWISSRKIDIKANSLYDLIAPGKYTKTNFDVNRVWKGLLAYSNPSLQTHCRKQGINVYTSHSAVRIGIIGNNEKDCNTPDSYIGLGTEGSSCGRNPKTSCGNEAGCGGDRGDQHIQSMGYIYVY
ncbi:uncharacterized skeletal organic matrix protein 5-like [Dendronephthya gigantea]|uniref:uncharacterized skeletal organic matrix protein 5-like n=1 Tax=Dendronephthya gigantea TaxID=151771 RepID=UPI001069D9E7|nr:uncharacterized skeletal organic matrix protein 5-like [Dendronephthya gigantea]XP_028409797.1 uncharacterized skeletal organic matrix protein 5-like [Dendronephthya gigantea]